MTDQSHKWWESPAIPPFRTVASRFMETIRNRDSYSASELLHAMHLLLAELYVAGLALPVKPETAYEGDDAVSPEIPSSDPIALEQHMTRWRTLHFTLIKQIGAGWNSYQEVFDPYADPPNAPVTGSLADDFADIFLDLEACEQLWTQGDYEAAAWESRFRFESHWGEHATRALRAIRTLAAHHNLGFPTR